MTKNNSTVMLGSENISLRTLSLDECQDYYVDWLNNPRVNQYLETRFKLQTLDTIAEYIKSVSYDDANYHFAIFRKDTDTHIGNIKLGPINKIHRSAEVSYFIGDVSSWGSGFASEAIQAVVRFAFNELGLYRIQAGVYDSNIGSVKCLEKCGFELEGKLRGKFMGTNGDRVSSLIYGLLRE